MEVFFYFESQSDVLINTEHHAVFFALEGFGCGLKEKEASRASSLDLFALELEVV